MREDSEPSRSDTDSALAIERHTARLVQLRRLTVESAADVKRALDRALADSRDARLAVVAFIDGVLHAHGQGLLDAHVRIQDGDGGRMVVHHAPVLELLVKAKLVTSATQQKLRTVLPNVEAWLPEAGISGFQVRHTFGPGDRRRGLVLDVVRAREFLKSTEAVPVR